MHWVSSLFSLYINKTKKDFEGSYCGLAAFGTPSLVSTAGLQYNLTNSTLQMGHLISSSNRISSTMVSVDDRTEAGISDQKKFTKEGNHDDADNNNIPAKPVVESCTHRDLAADPVVLSECMVEGEGGRERGLSWRNVREDSRRIRKNKHIVEVHTNQPIFWTSSFSPSILYDD